MRVVLDTNILVSALMVQSGTPGLIYQAWVRREFVLLISEAQLHELRMVFRKPSVSSRIRPHSAGRLVNLLRRKAKMVSALPEVQRAPDSDDDFLLATAEGGDADFLVTGDGPLLSLGRHKITRIVTAATFVKLLR